MTAPHTTPPHRVARWLLPVGLAITLSACSWDFSMPWDEDPFSPRNIQTGEPLEVPPNLDVLPEYGRGRAARQAEAGTEAQTTPTGGSAEVALEQPPAGDAPAAPAEEIPDSAAEIIFGSPSADDAAPLGRHTREHLPGWLEGDESQQER